MTSQLFTNRAFDAKVYAGPPYEEDTGRDTYNDSDGIFASSGELTLSTVDDGVLGLMTFDVQRG